MTSISKFYVSEKAGEVSAKLHLPNDAKVLLIYGHGAGAGMDHHFMESTAELFGKKGIATLRFNFPYTEKGKRAPDRPNVLIDTIAAAFEAVSGLETGLPIIIGGKSMGGRMASLAAAEGRLEGIAGLLFVGFPLHAPGKDSTERAAHLHDIGLPMLFLQGARDKLANIEMMRGLVKKLPKATIHEIEEGDHSFNVPKRTGRTGEEVQQELAEVAGEWVEGLTINDRG